MSYKTDIFFKITILSLPFLILGMVAIGGLTRLTGSGLSIVEWKPVVGILPPLTLQDWLIEFSKYKASPEYQKINLGMSLDKFQSIFWLEYIHRLFGRILGMILLVSTFLTAFKRRYRKFWPTLTFLWLLGLAQGAMGWIMVKSGLYGDPHVSPYRLAAHLFLGFAIFGVALWMSFTLYHDKLMIKRVGYSQSAFTFLKRLLFIALCLVLLTAFFGALVAGFQAGLVYNTFPFMEDRLIPNEFLTQSPWWKDILENPVSIQFLHRLFAITTAGFCVSLEIYQKHLLIPVSLSRSLFGVAVIALAQLSLGILTLLWQVPVALGILHQSFAFILFGILLYSFYLVTSRQKD